MLLNIVFLTAFAGNCLLASVNVAEHPKQFICKCAALKTKYGTFPTHLKSVGLFLEALSSLLIVVSVVLLDKGPSFTSVVWTIATSIYSYLWWKHTKRKRDKLKEKVLGVVKATAAGLKVVPVAAGSAAFVLALTACGAEAQQEPAPTPQTVAGSTGDWLFVKVPTDPGYEMPCVIYQPSVRQAVSISCDWRRNYTK